MHNCKETKEQLNELLLEGADRQPGDALIAELRGCAECRTESYWIGYHARLRQKLENIRDASNASDPSWLFRAFKSSIRVPVPVAVALIFVCVASLQFAIRTARQEIVRPLNTAVVRVPVEVPVVQEKIVTRVVYRERRLHRLHQTGVPTKAENTFAKSQKSQNEDIPASLTGFKPTDEIKLTVIKGGSSNEK